jgi:hypothetical protein
MLGEKSVQEAGEFDRVDLSSLKLETGCVVLDPTKLRGTKPEDSLLFKGDPDVGGVNHMEAEELKKAYDSCRPKLNGKTGKVLVFGTEGENDNYFKDVFYGK